MRRRNVFAVLLVSLIFLSGCGNSGKDTGGSGKADLFTRVSTETGSESDMESTTELSTDQSSDGNERKPREDKDILKTKWPFYQDTESGTSAELRIGYNAQGLMEVMLNTSCYEERDLLFQLSGIRINDRIRASDYSVEYSGYSEKDSADLKHEVETPLEDWKNVIQKMGGEIVHSIEFDFSIKPNGKEVSDTAPIHEEKILLQFPEDYRYGSIMDSFMGARADGQVVYEDERKTVRLIGFGAFNSSYNGLEPHLFLEVRNRSDTDTAFVIEGVILNGMFLDKNWTVSLKAGMTEFLDVDLDPGKIGEQEIDSISEMALVLSSNAVFLVKDKDTVNPVAVCPIELSEKGDGDGERDDGTEYYHDNGIRICLKKRDRIVDDEKGTVRYEWTFALINETDDLLTVSSVNKSVDRELSENDYFYCVRESIAPHTTVYATAYCRFNAMVDEPAISFQIEVVNTGENKYMFKTDQSIVVNPE